MPYTIVKRNNRFCVHKKNADGSVGERIACHDTKQSAIDQIGAIESSEKAIKEQDLEILMVQSETLLNLMYALVWADRLDDAAQVVSRITEQNEKIRGLIYLAERYGYRDDKETSTRYYAEAKQLIDTIENKTAKAYTLARLAASMADVGFIDQALEIAYSLTELSQKDMDQLKSYIENKIPRASVNKSYVTFKQDKNGDWWFIGLYSNKFKDREAEIISEEAHREYIEWVRDKGIKPQITLFHMPRAQPGFWYSVMQAYEKNMIRTETINTMLRDFYKDYAVAEAERVFYANGFVGVAGKVYKGREAWINNLSNYPDELGMSHGFIPIELDDNIYTKYRSFEMSILPKSRAANIWTKVDFVEGTMPLDAKDQEFLDNIQQGTAEEVDTATEETRQQLEDKGVEFKENETPEITVDTMINKLVETMKWDEFGQALHQQLTEINSRFDQIENRLKEVEQTEDEKVANLYQPNWQQFLPKKEGEEKKVEEQKHFDFLSALLTPKQN